jgi:glucokinase
MREIVAADIGGTHARFALAQIEDGTVAGLSCLSVLKAAEHASLPLAWRSFAAEVGRPLPRMAAIAVAGPVDGDAVPLTNNPWLLRPRALADELGLDRCVLVNDFGALAHAVARLGPEDFGPVCGPHGALSRARVVSIVGPGTGLGVAQLVRQGGRSLVVETEGGHADFAPLDPVEDAILGRLRRRFGRVSAERLVSGPGLVNIYAALADLDGRPAGALDDLALWRSALAGEDPAAAAAFERFAMMLGAFAGDVALAHGAKAVVIAGGLGQRLAERLGPPFEARFCAKGRLQSHMRAIPVVTIRHPEPGLYGAAAAFLDQEG